MKTPDNTRHSHITDGTGAVAALCLLLALAAPVITRADDDLIIDLPDDPTPTAATTTPDAPAKPDGTDAAKPEIQRQNLVTNSPFRAVRWTRRVTANAQPLEIRGFVGSGENLEVSITNPQTRECHWIKVRDENAKWYIDRADPIARTAVVRMDGILINLEIVKPTETPLPITAAGGAAVAARPLPAPVGGGALQIGPGGVPQTGPGGAAPGQRGTGAVAPAGRGGAGAGAVGGIGSGNRGGGTGARPGGGGSGTRIPR
ncbi:MAG: hypothetical protein LBV28_00730 [Puniceicoccales bacterium]|jgi:hypothetical protein|nr:hypothetical protein [Puniceicoccales bacterium]